MKIFLLADVHFGENRNYPNLKGEDYINVFGAEFERLAPELLTKVNECDLLIDLGDLISEVDHETDLINYKKAESLIQTDIPVKHVAGNHDLRNLSKEDFASLIDGEKSYYSFDQGGYHHVVLDGNRVEPRGPMFIDEEQLLWLENDLDNTEFKAVVYCHHPLDNQDMSDNYYFSACPERASINNKGFVRRVLNKSNKVLAVFSGHTHFYFKQVIDGIPYFTIPSFLENDGTGQPNKKFGLLTLTGDQMDVQIQKLD